MELDSKIFTENIIAESIEVHKTLIPDFLESVYKMISLVQSSSIEPKHLVLFHLTEQVRCLEYRSNRLFNLQVKSDLKGILQRMRNNHIRMNGKTIYLILLCTYRLLTTVSLYKPSKWLRETLT